MRHEIESLLFATGNPLPVEELAKHVGQPVNKVLDELAKLRTWYDNQDTALCVHETAIGWKLTVKDEYGHVTKKIVTDTELPFPEMETLAVIAYKNPILQSDVIKVRGAGAYEHIKTLKEHDFVQKEKAGRSYALKLTNHFFKYFDVEGETDIRELFHNRATKIKKKSDHEKKIEEQIEASKEREEEKEKQEIVPRADGEALLADIDKKLQTVGEKLETFNLETEKSEHSLHQAEEEIRDEEDEVELEKEEMQQEPVEEKPLAEDEPKEQPKKDSEWTEEDKKEPEKEKEKKEKK